MALMTCVNLMSARAYGEFEFWFSSIKVAAIISFILVVGAYVCGYRSPMGPTFSNLVAYGGFAPRGAFAVPAAVTTVIWSMMGAEVVTIAAAESPEPARAVARMTSTIISRIVSSILARSSSSSVRFPGTRWCPDSRRSRSLWIKSASPMQAPSWRQ